MTRARLKELIVLFVIYLAVMHKKAAGLPWTRRPRPADAAEA
jgi:hypothetical protein